MIRTALFASIFLAAAFAGPASANICQADNGVHCATGMPIEGYCECHVRGQTFEGTVVESVAPHHATTRRMSHSDCSANPTAPGCPR